MSSSLFPRVFCFCCFVISHITTWSRDVNISDTVSLYLGWYHQFQFAGYYAAVEKGYFEEEGLNVDLIQFDGNMGPAPVINGDCQYGVATAGQLIGSTSRDQLSIIAPIFQQSPLALKVRRNSGIESLVDLEGKKVAVGTELRAMMFVARVDFEKITFLPPTTVEEKLLRGEADAITHYIIDSVNTDEYRIFRPLEYGVNFYGECLFTTREEVNDHPDRVDRMKRAVLKGWQYAVDHPEEIIDLIRKEYNPILTKSNLLREAEIIIQSQILTSFYPIGYNDMARWNHMNLTFSKFMDIGKIDWMNFIYNPEERQELLFSRIIKISWVVGVVGIIILIGLFIYNRQLKKAVTARTSDIQVAKQQIEENNLTLTQQKEELESLNAFKDKILSIISHDVRGPLLTVQGLIDFTISGDITGDEFFKALKYSKNKIQDVNVFMDNILFWAKNQLKGIVIDEQIIEVRKLSRKTLNLLGPTATSKNIRIEDTIPAGLFARIDRETINLVIRNLVSNAVKFCSGGDKVVLSAIENNEMIRITVEDNGPGIEVERQESIFTSGYSSTPGSRDEAGTGLGLMLCREFVEKNGGSIGVESEPGKGSIFWFTIPKVNVPVEVD